MALPEFIESVRIAAGFLSPEVWTDSKKLKADEIKRGLELADMWLTPAIVDDFSKSDFVSLSEKDRDELAKAVEEFRAIAETVPGNKPATKRQRDEALRHFLTILKYVKPYIASEEAMKVRRAIWRACDPYRDKIPSFDFRLGWDAAGDPAVWVWLILNNDVDVTKQEVERWLGEVRGNIRAKLEEAGIRLWSYISVWGRDEVVPIVLGGNRI